MSKTLLDLTEQELAIDALLDRLDGDIPDDEAGRELEAFLDEHAHDLDAKLDAYAHVIAERAAKAEFRRREAKRYTALAIADDNAADRLKGALKYFFERTGRTKHETARFKFSLAKNGGALPLDIPQMFVDDPTKLDERFRRVRVEVDKDALRAALDRGEQLICASYGERGSSVRIK